MTTEFYNDHKGIAELVEVALQDLAAEAFISLVDTAGGPDVANIVADTFVRESTRPLDELSVTDWGLKLDNELEKYSRVDAQTIEAVNVALTAWDETHFGRD